MPAPKIFKETCNIDWKLPALRIHNLVRGLSPYPAAWSSLKLDDGEGSIIDVKIFETKMITDLFDFGKPGDIIILQDRLIVQTGDYPIEILSLQPAGKKRMAGDAFLRGYKPVKFI